MKPIKITYIILLFTVTSCAEEWLEIKQDKNVVVPQTLTDLQALLDNSSELNFSCTPMRGVIAADNFYLLDEDWKALSYPEERNSYIWAEDINEGSTDYNYNNPYQAILYANLVLEGIQRIDPEIHEQDQWNNIKGSALFYRSWMFFHLAQIYCKQYNAESAHTDLGIALRLESDVNISSSRATVQQTYQQIIRDLKAATVLLSDTPAIQTRPGKAAANALLARTFLQMGNFNEALTHAKATLNIHNSLIDYNTLDASADYPFLQMNDEVIFSSTLYPFSGVLNSMHVIPELLESFHDDDLRKSLYFLEHNQRIGFRGTYDGSSRQFNGLASDEIYLIAAECNARLGNAAEALTILNQLLKSRWITGTYQPLTETDNLLERILHERRKSLPFRGIRWMDLRRLNREEEFAVTLERTIDKKTFQLLPEDNRYVFPLPDDVIALSGMEQNPR